MSDWKPKYNPWIIAITVMIGTFMEVLDTSIANVALPHIAGSIGSTIEEATWMSTSYLVANAIVLPLTGWISTNFGRKNFLLICTVIFTISSVFCGLSQTLGQLIFFRILQGIGGGAMQPVAQTILTESFPPEKRGLAMAFYGLGVVVAPILGPIVGGWLTDSYSWRYCFYINLPVGMIALAASWYVLEDPPGLRQKTGSVDYIGFLLLCVWVGCLELAMDLGNTRDWLENTNIALLFVAAIIGLVVWIAWELLRPNPIVDLTVFKDRTFTISTILITVFGGVLYGSTTLAPLFLQQVLGYPAYEAGVAVASRGVGAMAAMLLVGPMMARVDARVFVITGFLLTGWSNSWLATFPKEVAMSNFTWPNIVSGLGIGFIFVPLSTVANQKIAASKIGSATGLFNLMRNLGGSAGIALANTMLTRFGQTRHHQLGEHINPYNPALGHYQAMLEPEFGDRWIAIVYNLMRRELSVMSYMDSYHTMGLLALACVPLCFFLSKPDKGAPAGGMH